MRTHSGSFYDKRSARTANSTYGGTRADWVLAYREARQRKNRGEQGNVENTGVRWKADLIIQFDRNQRDSILPTPADNKAMRIMTDEILAELIAEEAES